MFSYLDTWNAPSAVRRTPIPQLSKVSPCCEKVLFARYDLARLGREVDRNAFSQRPDSMWSFSSSCPWPTPDNVLTLGEGGRRC